MVVVAVALIEPQGHVNVGHVARLMKNFGLKRLYFVKPGFDRTEAVRYSTHGKDVLASAKTVTMKQLRKKFDIIIGTTAIHATSRLNILRESIGAEQMARIINYDGDSSKDFASCLAGRRPGSTTRSLPCATWW